MQTLHTAVNQGMRRAAEDPRTASQPIADCAEIIHEIMAGNVRDWIS
ncbi:MAG: hypothetical protein JOZ81_31370 [Chloroflexi bacterium]|nr:hypothetical protein [Chloroflexota bacterium]MBV9547414.1 hypothetical protein [Chloroflexota bacterium]